MKRKYPILGQVRDVEGSEWDVRDSRDTKHGFDLLFGSPVCLGPSGRCGLPRLIATQPLIDFWKANRARLGMQFDLPAGRTTLKRMRHRFGFNYADDSAAFWEERLEDLQKLSAREFAQRHNVNAHVAFNRRRKRIGRRLRDSGWWRQPRPLRILRSDIALVDMGSLLRISTSHAHRLQRLARGLV